MKRKPRPPDQPLFDRAMVKRSVLLGLLVLAFAAGVYSFALSHLPESSARALVFIGLVTANLSLIFVSRSGSANFATIYTKPNAVFWWIAAMAVIALAAVIYVPVVADAFRFTPPPSSAAGAVAVAAIALVLWVGSRVPTSTDDSRAKSAASPQR